MHPLFERRCDEILEDPALRTPSSIPETPPPPKVRVPREFKMPPRFPLVDKEFYGKWCNHQKEMQLSTFRVDPSPPPLFPELYLKPRTLTGFSKQLEENMKINLELVKRINLIQRTGGIVDCWNNKSSMSEKYNKRLCKQRQRVLSIYLASRVPLHGSREPPKRSQGTQRKGKPKRFTLTLQRVLNEITDKNLYFYKRILDARSEQLLTKELNKLWKETKHKLILGAKLPFVLFKTEKIDRGIRDTNFDLPTGVYRPRVSLEIWVEGGAKIGRIIIELFNDIVPNTCQLFLHLLKGDREGRAYTGTRIFRVVPNLYCCAGDVTKDNGFGTYVPEWETEPMTPENYLLNHTVPGVCSMAVTSDNEVYGHFNIIFKPLPQFDGKHVVFGRVIAGPPEALERISALGRPLGTTSENCVLRRCGWYSRLGRYRDGNANTVKFP